MRNKGLFRALMEAAAILTLGAMTLFPLGCSKMLPTAPAADPVKAFPAEDLWPKPPAYLVGWGQTCSAEGTKEFDPNGGKLKLQAECFKKLEFTVPKRAVSHKVLISVGVSLFNYWRDGELQKGFYVEFSPDDLAFAKPAELKIEIRELKADDGEVLRLYWYNPGTGLWEVEQEVVVTGKKKKAKFDIHHFSRYAISR